MNLIMIHVSRKSVCRYIYDFYLVRPFIFDLLFNEHLQSKARVGGRYRNKNKMWKLTFFGYQVMNNDRLCS